MFKFRKTIPQHHNHTKHLEHLPVGIFHKNCLVAGSLGGGIGDIKTYAICKASESNDILFAIDLRNIEYEPYQDRLTEIATNHQQALEMFKTIINSVEKKLQRHIVVFIDDISELFYPSYAGENTTKELKKYLKKLIKAYGVSVVIFSQSPKTIRENKWIPDLVENKILTYLDDNYKPNVILGNNVRLPTPIKPHEREGYYFKDGNTEPVKFKIPSVSKDERDKIITDTKRNRRYLHTHPE